MNEPIFNEHCLTMSDDEDERAEAFAKAIVSFDVDKLDDYSAEVILQFRAGMLVSLADLKKIASEKGVKQTFIPGVPRSKSDRWYKPKVVRDLIAAQHNFGEDEDAIVSQETIGNGWVASVSEDEDSDGGSKSLGSPPSATVSFAAPPVWAGCPPELQQYLNFAHNNMLDLQRSNQALQLQITRMHEQRDSKRELGYGLGDYGIHDRSQQLLWGKDSNPFEQRPVEQKEFQSIIRDNSAAELPFWKAPGFGAQEKPYISKKELSIDDVWRQTTKPVLNRLEVILTTLVSAHTCTSAVQDVLTELTAEGSGVPANLKDKISQVEFDTTAAVGRTEAVVALVNSLYAHLCHRTQQAVAKKMSAGAAETLALSDKPQEQRHSTMLTAALLQTLEEERKKTKTINHALDAKAARRPPHGGNRGGGGHAGAGKGNRKSGAQRRQNKKQTQPQKKTPAPKAPAPAPAPAKRS